MGLALPVHHLLDDLIGTLERLLAPSDGSYPISVDRDGVGLERESAGAERLS